MINKSAHFLVQKIGDRAFEATMPHAKTVPLLELLRKAYAERAQIRRNDAILYLEVTALGFLKPLCRARTPDKK